MKVKIAAVSLLASAVQAGAELPIGIDGFRDSLYGPAVAVQTVQVDANGTNNELDAAYAAKDTEFLHLMLTGNLDPSFSRLEIFLDSRSGGQNQIIGATNTNNDNWAMRFDQFTFDEGFVADFLIIARHGVDAEEGHVLDIDFTTIAGAGGQVGHFAYDPAVSTGPFVCDNGIEVGLDNSNTAGVGVGTDAADQAAAAAVRTGIELRIPLELIGEPADAMKVSAFINNQQHVYLYNQFLGGVAAGTGKLGSDGNGVFFGGAGGLFLVDMNDFPGEQFFVVQPFSQDPAITQFGIDRDAGTATLDWRSSIGGLYTLEFFTETEGWLEVTDGIESAGVSTSYTHLGAPLDVRTLLYRIREE